MSLVQAWRKVRSAERAWWQKVQLCILWQGWRSWLVVYMDRAALSSEISGLVALMHRRLAIIERTIDITFDNKTKLVRSDRRQASIAILVDAAQRAERGDDKGYYEKLSPLRPWKARPLPMLRKYDGSFARTQEEIASRWVEHVSSEMGGFPSSFEELAVSAAPMLDACTDNPCPVLPCMPLPSLDDVLDRLMASAKGKALGPDSIPT